MKNVRISKDNYYLDIASAVAKRSPCLKKHYGAVLVQNDRIIATGYNGPCRGEPHCTVCTKVGHGKDLETYNSSCASVHAEMNCLLSASGSEMLGATLYLAGFDVETNSEIEAWPCSICNRLINNAGIDRVNNRLGIIYQRSDADNRLYQIKEKI